MRVETLEDLDSVRSDWGRLAERSGNVFSTWEWASAWYRHLGAGRPIRVGVARRDGGEVAAVIPLFLDRRWPLRALRFLGSGPADELGPVCAPEDRTTAAAATASLADEWLGRAGVLLAERLPGGVPWAQWLGATTLRRAPSPVLPIEGRSFEDFLASRSRNFRSQVRRRERALAREHDLVFHLTRDPETLGRDMQTLFRLHGERWREGGSDAFTGARRPFHLDFAREALERGWLRLWTLELDGVPVAAWHGFRYGGVESYYQAGRDPSFDRLHVGVVLLAHTIRSAFEDGVREYRFGLGGEDYKSRFTTEDRGVDTLARPAGAAGRLAVASLRAGLALRDRRRAGPGAAASGDDASPSREDAPPAV